MHIKLKPNQIINIYTDFKEEEGYEGKARLIKRVRKGDSFYRKDEKLELPDKKVYNRKEQSEMRKLNRLSLLLKGDPEDNRKPEKECKNLYKNLLSLRKDSLSDFHNMSKLLSRYRKRYSDSVRRIKSVLTDYDDDYIIRFIQQDRDDWTPTIFNYERWKVQFIEDHTGWDCDFITERNIRIISKVNPTEYTKDSDIKRYTTYNSFSSLKYKQNHVDAFQAPKQNIQTKEQEFIYISDEEMDALIEKKMS